MKTLGQTGCIQFTTLRKTNFISDFSPNKNLNKLYLVYIVRDLAWLFAPWLLVFGVDGCVHKVVYFCNLPKGNNFSSHGMLG